MSAALDLHLSDAQRDLYEQTRTLARDVLAPLAAPAASRVASIARSSALSPNTDCWLACSTTPARARLSCA